MIAPPLKVLHLLLLPVILLATFLPGSAANAQQAPALAVSNAQQAPALAVSNPETPAGLDNFSRNVLTDRTTHLTVGHSVVLNTKHRLTRVYITDPAVLDSFTASPTQVVCTAKAAGLSSVMVWDETGEMATYLFASDVNVETLRESIKRALPGETIEVQGNEGRIVLTGSVSSALSLEAAAKLAGIYSKDVSNALLVNSAGVKQVRLKVRIVEVDRSKMDQFAFNFTSAGGSLLAQTSTNQFPSAISTSNSGSAGTGTTAGDKTVSVSNALNFLLYSSRLNVGATIQDLESRQVLQILAEPTITALNGQKANFLAGGEFPFPVVQGGAGGLTSITIQFRPYGVKLEFLPTVNPDGSIQLQVAPEVSALDYTNAVTISGYTIPALSTRRAETQVVLKSGQSFAISGLLDKRTTDSYTRTPGAANIPVIGQLFKSKSINHSTTELVVIVTPTIFDPLSTDLDAPVPEPARIIPLLDPQTFDEALPHSAVHPQ